MYDICWSHLTCHSIIKEVASGIYVSKSITEDPISGKLLVYDVNGKYFFFCTLRVSLLYWNHLMVGRSFSALDLSFAKIPHCRGCLYGPHSWEWILLCSVFRNYWYILWTIQNPIQCLMEHHILLFAIHLSGHQYLILFSIGGIGVH